MQNQDFRNNPNGEKMFFEPKPETEKEEDYLSKEDIFVLQKGLQKLWEMFTSMDEKDLPSDIIFPEAAARPLFYAVKPLIDTVYIKRGQPKPKFHFLVVHSKQRSLEDLQYYQQQLQNLEKTKSDEDEDEISSLQDMISEIKTSLQAHNEVREPEQLDIPDELILENEMHLYNRLDEILHTGNEKVLIIDDMIDKRTTVDLIGQTFAELKSYSENSKQNPLTFFAFYSKKNQENPLSQEDMVVISGLDDTTKDLEQYAGFRYRDDFSFNPNKSARYRKDLEAALGVKKYMGEKYVSPAKNKNPKKMQALRDFLKNQGNIFLRQKDF
jgi:hypothetical protein